MSELSLETCSSNLKSVALTVLEILHYKFVCGTGYKLVAIMHRIQSILFPDASNRFSLTTPPDPGGWRGELPRPPTPHPTPLSTPVYRCLHRHTSPSRSSWLLKWKLDDIFVPPTPWRWLFQQRVVQRSAIEHFRCQPRGPGTPRRLPSELHRHSLRFGRSLNIHFFRHHFPMTDSSPCVYTMPL